MANGGAASSGNDERPGSHESRDIDNGDSSQSFPSADILASSPALVHPRVPQLLAGQAFPAEYVCEYR